MSKKATENAKVRLAENILRGQAATARETFDLAMALKTDQQFGYARTLLARARVQPEVNDDPEFRTTLRQQHALCTYKDPDLANCVKFNRAMEILSECENLQTTTNQETLGIAGAIYKYKWQAFAQQQDLEISLSYYSRGLEQGFEPDRGFTAINTAYVLDLLADQEWVRSRQIGVDSRVATDRIELAKSIRRRIVKTSADLLAKPGSASTSLKNDWWFLVTMAEAHFGVEEYDEALPWLAAAAKLPNIPEWERETTARQLASLARLLMRRAGKEADIIDSEAWRVVETFLGDRAPGVATAFLGKVGLALSGGGFRASLFHIGVLARLAELDILRYVEVLSCVSGGSIVGAHYYLKVRRLLESTDSKDIDRSDYIRIVQDLENEFLSGVQKNIRTRVIGSFRSNLRMAFQSDYSRTERVGELYEQYLFAQADGTPGPFWLNDLYIRPLNESDDFRPKYHNWRRSAKVPILVLNATTLNTGHNWQFTASWMGEPPVGPDSVIDANYRLRRMYYSEAPEPYKGIRLGHAVAASACVPGLFDPLTLAELYPDIAVRLVDGGVHDNQGTSALLEQDCNVLLVSDASGQMDQEDAPARDFLRVPLRSNSILQSRIRGAQYEDLGARNRSSLLKGLMFVHLKQDLDADAVDWKNCEDPAMASEDARPAYRHGELTCYGIRKDIQRRLAAIRTDLDSFNDVEACALMVSGYRMTQYAFARSISGFPPAKPVDSSWRFMGIENLMQRRGDDEKSFNELTTLLDAGKMGPLKIWHLDPVLRVLGTAIPVAAFLIVLYLCYSWRETTVVARPYNTIFVTLASAAGSLLLAKLLGPKIANLLTSFGTPRRIRSELWRVAAYIPLAFVGFVLAGIHIGIFDRWYLRRGRLERILGETATQPGKAQ